MCKKTSNAKTTPSATFDFAFAVISMIGLSVSVILAWGAAATIVRDLIR